MVLNLAFWKGFPKSVNMRIKQIKVAYWGNEWNAGIIDHGRIWRSFTSKRCKAAFSSKMVHLPNVAPILMALFCFVMYLELHYLDQPMKFLPNLNIFSKLKWCPMMYYVEYVTDVHQQNERPNYTLWIVSLLIVAGCETTPSMKQSDIYLSDKKRTISRKRRQIHERIT